ncbi:MAG: helix-turn-helix domain-containing protein [Ruminococcaceae bacterium]|nr:helix-turn-helix domain-containing protein [Oscillospiraceae bacterium]
MENQVCWSLTEEEKEKFISALTPELVLLRTKAEISQEELAMLIGISRQTYGAIERRIRRMSWSTFLSLIMFYDYNQKTHQVIRALGAFPYDIVKHYNGGVDLHDVEIEALFGNGMKTIVDCLDEQALRSIRTLIMVEWARCTQTPGDVVIKSFDGKNFIPTTQMADVQATKALRTIKEQNHRND